MISNIWLVKQVHNASNKFREWTAIDSFANLQNARTFMIDECMRTGKNMLDMYKKQHNIMVMSTEYECNVHIINKCGVIVDRLHMSIHSSHLR